MPNSCVIKTASGSLTIKIIYDKRKESQESKKNETNDEKKTNINWDISTDVKPHSNPYEIEIP